MADVISYEMDVCLCGHYWSEHVDSADCCWCACLLFDRVSDHRVRYVLPTFRASELERAWQSRFERNWSGIAAAREAIGGGALRAAALEAEAFLREAGTTPAGFSSALSLLWKVNP